MALETLKGVKEIGGYEIKRVSWNQPLSNYIELNETGNAITFNIQDGPIRENGVNGCQVDTLIHAARKIILELDRKYPSNYNKDCIGHLTNAIDSLDQRTKDREKRNVEGTSQV